jgi:2-polyprenyl-3-methyl-5-hydroxy-6-metoxy-1,4-benzoquinol methylase
MGVQERLTLQAVAEPTLLAAEHIHRYEFAAGLCAGLRVLDLCCGSGYGSEVLATTAATVHGVDYDAATIDLAATTVGLAGSITFELADATAFLREEVGDRFDAIVCFEGLEHLPDVEAALRELRRHAARGVAVIASVPNSRGLGEENEFHLTDFGYAEARAALGGFPGGVVVHQYLAEGSLLVLDGAGDLEARLHGLERAEPPYANHFLLVAGVSPERLAATHRARMSLAVAPNYNRYMQSLERANTELRRRNNQLARNLLGKADSAAASYIKRTEERLAELGARAAELEEARAELAHRQRRIARLEKQVEFAREEAARAAAQGPGASGGILARLQRRLGG